MINTAEIFLWGTRIGIIQTVSSVKEEYVSYMKDAGVSAKTAKTLLPILPMI